LSEAQKAEVIHRLERARGDADNIDDEGAL
jgi:hypothetical protein